MSWEEFEDTQNLTKSTATISESNFVLKLHKAKICKKVLSFLRLPLMCSLTKIVPWIHEIFQEIFHKISWYISWKHFMKTFMKTFHEKFTEISWNFIKFLPGKKVSWNFMKFFMQLFSWKTFRKNFMKFHDKFHERVHEISWKFMTTWVDGTLRNFMKFGFDRIHVRKIKEKDTRELRKIRNCWNVKNCVRLRTIKKKRNAGQRKGQRSVILNADPSQSPSPKSMSNTLGRTLAEQRKQRTLPRNEQKIYYFYCHPNFCLLHNPQRLLIINTLARANHPSTKTRQKSCANTKAKYTDN
jgi:hypothetical protein